MTEPNEQVKEALILLSPFGPLYAISKIFGNVKNKCEAEQSVEAIETIETIGGTIGDNVLKNIQDVKLKLEEAYMNERCELCKERIKEALDYINEELEVVERTHRIYWAMENLKSKGLIPDVDWDELSEEDKKLVKKVAGYG